MGVNDGGGDDCFIRIALAFYTPIFNEIDNVSYHRPPFFVIVNLQFLTEQSRLRSQSPLSSREYFSHGSF
jgi:hypothetical protein